MRIDLTIPANPSIALEVSAGTPGGGNVPYKIGHGLKVVGGSTLTVDTADSAEQDNTLPITAAAVYTEIGNIDVLLQTV